MDEEDSYTTFSTNSLLSDIDVVNVVPAPNNNKPKFQTTDKPCYRMATDGVCDTQACRYSHDTDQIKKCRQELMAKLKKLDNT
jgi:hypothetical protein